MRIRYALRLVCLWASRILCLTLTQDVYLYYFLLRYPGRSLVFLSSIDGIRRLLPLMELLQLKAYPLHSQLQQRQRLKNLDRYVPSHLLINNLPVNEILHKLITNMQVQIDAELDPLSNRYRRPRVRHPRRRARYPLPNSAVRGRVHSPQRTDRPCETRRV